MKWKVWIVGVVVLLLLSGCNTDSGSGHIEVVYPSGYTRTNTWDELTPIEGTSYQLQAPKAADYDKTHGDDSIQVIWESTDWVLTSNGKYQPVFSEKVTYEVSLLGAVQISNLSIVYSHLKNPS